MFYKRGLSIFYHWKKLSFFSRISRPWKGRKVIDVLKHQNMQRKATGANGIFRFTLSRFFKWTTKQSVVHDQSQRPRSINRIVSTEGLCHWTRPWFNNHCVICKLMLLKGSRWSTCLREAKDSITWLLQNDLTKRTATAKQSLDIFQSGEWLNC